MSMQGRRDELIVYFSGSWWDQPPGHDRHMAEALAKLHPVLFVEPPISALTRFWHPALAAQQATKPTLQVLHPRLAMLVPRVVPGITRPGLRHLVAPMMRRAARQAVNELYPGDRSPVAVILSSRLDSLWSALPARRKVFFATDDLTAGAEMLGVPRARLLRAEARTLRGADSVAAVSQALQERYTRAGHPTEFVPNGCSPERFSNVDNAERPADVSLPGPIAGFVGQLNERTDFALLEAVADTGGSLLIVGPRMPGYEPQRFEALIARPNVCWVGPKSFAEMPGYLRLIDVGLTPYADNAFNRASFPLKTLEYLAAGRAAVATPLPANDWLDTDLIELASTPTEFAATVGAALDRPRTPELAMRRRAFAREHSWDNRAALLAKLL